MSTSRALPTKWRAATREASRRGILRALREDLELGYLENVRLLVAADLFSDFIEMAEHLLETGYKDPAASLTGAVLEDGLRKIAAHNGITLKSKEDLSSLNTKCADGGVYNRLVQKKINVWIGVRITLITPSSRSTHRATRSKCWRGSPISFRPI
jgi:hypothetical protein